MLSLKFAALYVGLALKGLQPASLKHTRRDMLLRYVAGTTSCGVHKRGHRIDPLGILLLLLIYLPDNLFGNSAC